MKILILCTGNSCRSQMAEGLLKSYDNLLKVYSAGTEPADETHPIAIKVMNEIGVSIHNNRPKKVDQFLEQPFDFVITVCDDAKESCPVFIGKVKNRLHIGFEDPAKAEGTEEEKLLKFREIRDQIHLKFFDFFKTQIQIK